MNTTEKQQREPAIWPTFQAHDAPAVIDFLVDTVGFLRTAVYREGGQVVHAQLDWPEGGGVMLGSLATASKACGRMPGTLGAYIVTDRVDELYERLGDAGVKVVQEMKDQPPGGREFTIADPEGNMWTFGTYRGEPRPPE